MSTAPNEKRRLAALRRLRILDTPSEPRFDRITHLAARLFGVPIALVSLVDEDRLWFKSAHGLDQREAPRADSFCAVAVEQATTLVVPDVQQDPRFANHPLVTGPAQVRFYAGHPLSAPDGSPVGTLCILDREPRQLTETERDRLRELAALAEGQLTLVGAAELEREVVEHRRAEKTVMEQALQLWEKANLLDLAHDAILVRDADGRITFWNRGAERTFGWSGEEAIGQVTHELLQTQFPKPRAEIEAELLANDRWEGEVIHRRKDGRGIMVAARWSVQRDRDGESRTVLEIHNDITERKRAELEAEAARAAAEAANRAKSDFLANMSHEIRTPMTAILGFTDLLLEDLQRQGATPTQLDAIRTVRVNAEHLLGIINNILDISKIEAGKLEVESIPCAPAQVLANAVALMRPQSEAKGLYLKAEYQSEIPETIRSDPTRLRQILINLVGNAIKFTERGGIRIQVDVRNPKGPRPVLEFRVIDTGVGMDRQHLARLFQPFTQADTSTARKYGGSGLGLAISRRLAEALGGGITVGSLAGRGSTFTVSIPTGPLTGVRMVWPADESAARPEAPVAPADSSPLLNCRVLLAEDGPDNQRLISHHLKKAGASVTVAEDGRVAVARATEARGEGRPFDVILMDMQMPVLDGYEATRKLRAQGYTGPIIALTAHAMTGDREKCLECGCDAYATKPIDRKELIGTIVAQLRRPACPTTSS